MTDKPLHRLPAAERIRIARRFVGKVVDVDEAPYRNNELEHHRGLTLVAVAGANVNRADFVILRRARDLLAPGRVYTTGPYDIALSLATVARIAEAAAPAPKGPKQIGPQSPEWIAAAKAGEEVDADA